MRLFIFGLGFAGRSIAAAARANGCVVAGTGRAGGIAFVDSARIAAALADATHIVSTVPPDADGDPVRRAYGAALAGRWCGYCSSTGVYGDRAGAWVDEHTPVGGRRPLRDAADAAWLAAGACVMRLPGIYGPGRSPLDRVRDGTAHRVAGHDAHVFSRIHVADIASAMLMAAMSRATGAFNIADDRPASANEVTAFAARLLGLPPPPLVPLSTLSPMARGFYADHRRVANGKAKRVLGWRPAYPDYAAGLRALSAISSPMAASTEPPMASTVQR